MGIGLNRRSTRQALHSDVMARPVDTAGDLAANALTRIQDAAGAWEGEVVWCPIITAQVIILHAIARRPPTPERRRLLLRQFVATHRPDGGWGLHPESASYRFVTTLAYVAVRLLGEPETNPMLVKARAFLDREPGGIFSLPQWGKVWLSFIGLFDPRGLKPSPPELFLLPRWLPFSPLRFYCHTRHIYLGMSYLIGSGFRADIGPIAAQLRDELYGACPPEQAIRHRHDLARSDAYVRPGRGLRLLYDAVYALGRMGHRLPGAAWLRRRALDNCMARIAFEQRATRFQGLSPVSGVLNTLALYSRDPGGADTQRSFEGLESWRWDDEADGSRYAGARSTTWDTSFAIQALLAGGTAAASKHADALRLGYRRLAQMQMTSELEGGASQARDPVLGGWCFSDGVHRWPVSDCAAEAIIALLDCHGVPGLIPDSLRLPEARLAQAADFILSRQNRDGGFGTYERRRGHRFLEKLNPSEMFGQCMTELSYLECTGSSVRALVRLQRTTVGAQRERARSAIDRGVALILERQQRDGSWPGFWGINFIYGTHFAVAALREAGVPLDHAAFRKAARWLESIQHDDGGWGEHFSGCLDNTYVDSPGSLIISTAWACLALMHAEPDMTPALERGIAYLIDRQAKGGGWPREGVNGVFFGTAMLEYKLYNSYFPSMALGLFERRRHAAR
jgi:squalene/oxidosqualene cyclase-like protein